MLHHVGVRPYLLVGITRQTAVGGSEEAVGVGETVRTGGPTGTVAACTTDFTENLAPFLNLRIIEMTGGGHSQTAVPNHQVDVIIVTHLSRQILVHQVVVYICFRIARNVVFREVGIEMGLDLGVLRSHAGVGFRHVVIATVAARHIGDVPDGVRTRAVLQRTTGAGVSETLRMVGFAVQSRGGPIVTRPHRRVQFRTRIVFTLILSLQRVVRNSIQQTRTIDADRRFKTHFFGSVSDGRAVRFQRNVVGGGRNIDFGINQAVRFAVGKTVAPLIRIVYPGNLNLAFVDRSLERRHSLGLRHTGKRRDVVVVLIRNHQKIAVAPIARGVTVHTFTMTVPRVTSDARTADVQRS